LDAALDQDRRRRPRQPAGLAARLDRGFEARIQRRALARQRVHLIDGFPQVGRTIVGVAGGRSQAFDHRDPSDPLRQEGSDEAGDAAAQRVAEQGETPPAQRVGGGDDIRNEIDEMVMNPRRMVMNPRRAVLGMAVSGQIQRHQPRVGQQRREGVEAGGVIQPAVQGQHRNAVRRSPSPRRQPQIRRL